MPANIENEAAPVFGAAFLYLYRKNTSHKKNWKNAVKTAPAGQTDAGVIQMETYFHGARRRKSYFEGWYLKHQTRSGRALALIPAFHIDGEGRRSASLQVIADKQSWWLDYPAEEFQAAEEVFRVRLERWSADGAALRQGEYRLTAEVLGERPQLLRAPVGGGMGRTVHESLQARVRYRFWAGEKLLFDHTDDHASFEYAGPQADASG